MRRIVFLLEELSMKLFLDALLPRIFPRLQFLCVPHEGKSDLEKSIPRKLKAWREPGVCFMIVRDNDGGDCARLKGVLLELCQRSGRTDALVRIACQELEAWYLGDLQALSLAYQQPKLAKLADKARYRDPDTIMQPSSEIGRLIPEFQKLTATRRVGEFLSEEKNRLTNFKVFLAGVRRIIAGCDLTN
jgi:hypothetical protein